MSDQRISIPRPHVPHGKVNDLETRIEQTIDRATDDWMNDPRINTSYHTHVAQAIVQEFGLRREFKPPILAHEKGQQRIIGNWVER